MINILVKALKSVIVRGEVYLTGQQFEIDKEQAIILKNRNTIEILEQKEVKQKVDKKQEEKALTEEVQNEATVTAVNGLFDEEDEVVKKIKTK